MTAQDPKLPDAEPVTETKSQRADRLYGDYRSAMLFFGETPAPQVKQPKG